MEKTSFSMTKRTKNSFYRNKKLFMIDVNKILVSEKEPYGKKKLI